MSIFTELKANKSMSNNIFENFFHSLKKRQAKF